MLMGFLFGVPSVEGAVVLENRIKVETPESQEFIGGFERFAVKTQQVSSSYLGYVASDSPIAPSKKFSKDKQALVDMAKKDKKTGMTKEDMQAYKDLNKELPDPFPTNKVRGPEVHPNRPHGKEPHGHVGPVNHIPIKD